MDGSLYVAECNGGALVRVVGAFTSRVSHALAAVIEPDATLHWWLDGSAVTIIDSTAIGELVRLEQHDRVQLGPFSESACKVFAMMHLLPVLNLSAELPAPDGAWVPVATHAASAEALGRHVLASHLALAEQGGPQGAVFASLCAKLRAELDAG